MPTKNQEILTKLEQLLSLTERFNEKMSSKEHREWQEISAKTADWREENGEAKRFQACFVNSETPPNKTKHISWFVREESIEGVPHFSLYEVVEEEFPHPDAPEDAIVFRQNTYHVKTEKSKNAAELVLLKAAQDTISKLNKERQ